jgi:hypothetical protein
MKKMSSSLFGFVVRVGAGCLLGSEYGWKMGLILYLVLLSIAHTATEQDE